MIEDRKFKILDLIKSGINNILDLSNNLKISERMLRYDIDILNKVFKYYISCEIIGIKIQI